MTRDPMIRDPKARDHGGNLDEACARFGGAPGDWLDLSTGINPVAWPVTVPGPAAWTRLPDRNAFAALEVAARAAYGVAEAAVVVPAGGTSALIRLMPLIGAKGRVAIPGPTYNEHRAAFEEAGWQVTDRPGPNTAAMVIVNPNNPDGRRWTTDELLLLAEAVPLMVVDESFMDLTPEQSLAPLAGRDGLVVLRSFGKFFGLAGLRLGFAIIGPGTATRLEALLGPWAISGPALEIGARALADSSWVAATRARLAADGARLAALGRAAGWDVVGGAGLFTTFTIPDAAAAQERLARARIWSRIFPYSTTWLRLGLPGDAAGWARLAAALEG